MGQQPDQPRHERRNSRQPCLLNCPVCSGAMEVVYARNNQQVCACLECKTTITVPANAWEHAPGRRGWRRGANAPERNLYGRPGMRLSLQPNGQVAHTRPHSYIVELPDDTSAILDAVDGRWHLTIRHSGKVIDRGMFATTAEVLDLLDAEFMRSAAGPRE